MTTNGSETHSVKDAENDPTDIKKKWVETKTASEGFLSSEAELNTARMIMQTMLSLGAVPPFKITKGNLTGLSHSFAVAPLNNGKLVLVEFPGSKNPAEGILGAGSFGMCRFATLDDENLTRIAVKVQPDESKVPIAGTASQLLYENAIMKHLGILLGYFEHTFDERKLDAYLKNLKEQGHNVAKKKMPNEDWIHHNRIGDKHYQFTHLIDGERLSTYLVTKGPTQTLEEMFDIGVGIAEALQDLHNQDVIHNDLHKGNVMVDSHNKVHIVDFGKSIYLGMPPKNRDEFATRTGMIKITAPEVRAFYDSHMAKRKQVLEDRAKLDLQTQRAEAIKLIEGWNKYNENLSDLPFKKTSDMYSLGMLLKRNFRELLKEHSDESKQLHDLLNQLTEPDPAKRTIAIDEVLKQLKELKGKFLLTHKNMQIRQPAQSQTPVPAPLQPVPSLQPTPVTTPSNSTQSTDNATEPVTIPDTTGSGSSDTVNVVTEVKKEEEEKEEENTATPFLLMALLLVSASKGDRDLCENILKSKLDINTQDKDGNTALMLAAKHGHSHLCTFLVEN
ncbi:MAG: protein kinase, partial [Proteobacteria bacterium]|nr:protein kinase [Pseudomonadota bacterium]